MTLRDLATHLGITEPTHVGSGWMLHPDGRAVNPMRNRSVHPDTDANHEGLRMFGFNAADVLRMHSVHSPARSRGHFMRRTIIDPKA
jgi:hypothetical protein